MNADTDTIYLVDDDPSVLTAHARMLRAHGWTVEVFESAEAFLARPTPHPQGCLVLDVSMPGLNGLQLQQRLSDAGRDMPIVFLTGQGSIPMTVQAIQAGAIDFLEKPTTADTLISAVRTALAKGEALRQANAEVALFEQRLAKLSPREREVLVGIVNGRLNKQIAADLGIVEQTVKFHRARIMQRMEARTVAELMHIAARLGIEAAPD
ncbi:response regulator [Variovorax sp. J22R133]|uniref:response regulator transcription factor n=1 Tax=Variovorax brevis TaxID=3053503 RepID=UPI00257646CA|nr:response regulator [Variovorax sp. J22R133]MDM0114975.1 response regulator [Variovorax sp. J22R133]